MTILNEHQFKKEINPAFKEHYCVKYEFMCQDNHYIKINTVKYVTFIEDEKKALKDIRNIFHMEHLDCRIRKIVHM